MPTFSQTHINQLNKLANKACQNELGSELARLKISYGNNPDNSLDGFEESPCKKNFDQTIARQISTYYQHVEPELSVANAVARNILSREEIPLALLKKLEDTIVYYQRSSQSVSR